MDNITIALISFSKPHIADVQAIIDAATPENPSPFEAYNMSWYPPTAPDVGGRRLMAVNAPRTIVGAGGWLPEFDVLLSTYHGRKILDLEFDPVANTFVCHDVHAELMVHARLLPKTYDDNGNVKESYPNDLDHALGAWTLALSSDHHAAAVTAIELKQAA